MYAGPRRHRQAVAACPARVAGIAENLPQPACRQHGISRQDTNHLAGFAIQRVHAMTGGRLINRQRVQRVMRKRDEINGGVLQQQADVGPGLQRFQHFVGNRGTGHVAYVDNPAGAVGRFQPVHQFAVRVTIKLHPTALHQHRAHQVRPFLRQQPRRLWRA